MRAPHSGILTHDQHKHDTPGLEGSRKPHFLSLHHTPQRMGWTLVLENLRSKQKYRGNHQNQCTHTVDIYTRVTIRTNVHIP